MITQTETQVITLTAPQLKALICACKYPSQATVRGKRHQFTDVHTLVEYGLVEWLHREQYNFIPTDKGRAYNTRYHAIEKKKSEGWQVYPLEPGGTNWYVLATPSGEHGLYESESAAWNTALASAAVQS